MGSGEHKNEEINFSENTDQAASLLHHPLKRTIWRFLRNAVLLVAAFALVHLLGFKEYISVLSGTASYGICQRMFGALYLVLYMGFVFMTPVLIIAAGLLQLIMLATNGKHDK